MNVLNIYDDCIIFYNYINAFVILFFLFYSYFIYFYTDLGNCGYFSFVFF